MVGCSEGTETLRQEVVQMKAKGMILSDIAREKLVIPNQVYSDTNQSLQDFAGLFSDFCDLK